jgi:hypothetical protein
MKMGIHVAVYKIIFSSYYSNKVGRTYIFLNVDSHPIETFGRRLLRKNKY